MKGLVPKSQNSINIMVGGREKEKKLKLSFHHSDIPKDVHVCLSVYLIWDNFYKPFPFLLSLITSEMCLAYLGKDIYLVSSCSNAEKYLYDILFIFYRILIIFRYS